MDKGTARLVGGSADADGAWAYGRLEVFDGSFFSSVKDSGSLGVGRRGAQVACRSLGFAAGAQIVSGEFSALPGDTAAVDTVSRISCHGDEPTLAACEIIQSSDYGFDYGSEDATVALICSNPSGAPIKVLFACAHQRAVRLRSLRGVPVATDAKVYCCAMHLSLNLARNGQRMGGVRYVLLDWFLSLLCFATLRCQNRYWLRKHRYWQHRPHTRCVCLYIRT